jgi:dTDP-glucose 4,6-dehydratase
MRTLITGANGFLGSYLKRALTTMGHEVIQTNDFNSPVEGPIDFVIHFASHPSPKDHLKMPIETLMADSEGTLALLEIARGWNATFLFASTAHIDQPGDPTSARSVYKEGKRFAEALISAYQRKYQLSTKIVRMFNSYGPGMRLDDGRAVPTFVVKALRNEPITLIGGGQLINLCYVDDVINAILTVLFSNSPAPVEIGGSEQVTIQQLAELIIELTGSKSRLEIIPEYVESERLPNNSKIYELGWRPQVSLRYGLKIMVENFKERMKGGVNE